MNFRLISRFLGVVAFLIGVSMMFSLPWGTELFGAVPDQEKGGIAGLLYSILLSFGLSGIFYFLGRNSNGQIFRKEAIAVVALSWILAAFLGALPFFLSGTELRPDKKMSFADALFESQSGFSTTGATVLSDIENRDMVPKTILFWRSTTHFLGGLGIMVLFVGVLGQGAAVKSIMRTEKGNSAEGSPQARVRHLAVTLLKIYVFLNILLTFFLVLEGLTFFDALCHSFSTIATGGFSTFNASVGHFAAETSLNAPLIEWTLIFFMFISGMNFTLLYFLAIGQWLRVFKDVEWRTYAGILLVGILLIFAIGLYRHDFDIYGTSNQPIRSEQARIERQKSKLLGQNQAEQNQAEQNQAEQNQADQNQANQNQVEQNQAEQNQAEQNQVEQNQANQNQDEKKTSESIFSNRLSDASFPSNFPKNSFDSAALPNIKNGASDVKPELTSWNTAFRQVVFNAVSLMTSTGFCTDEYEKWNSFSLVVILALMAIGGCAGSTSGGLKVNRLVLAVCTFKNELERFYRPNIVRTIRVGDQSIEKDYLASTITFLFFYCFIIFLGTLIINFIEPDVNWTRIGKDSADKFLDLFSVSVSMFSNTGPGFGIAGARENYGDFTVWSKLLFCFAMLFGRLEIYVPLVIFSPNFWKNR